MEDQELIVILIMILGFLASIIFGLKSSYNPAIPILIILIISILGFFISGIIGSHFYPDLKLFVILCKTFGYIGALFSLTIPGYVMGIKGF